MCLIIHKPAGIKIPADLIKQAWDDNNDGAGLMFHNTEAGQASVFKVLPKSSADPSQMLTEYLSHLDDVEVGVHFRWRTHGPIDVANTHPYQLPGNRGWLMHNGVLGPALLGAQYQTVSDIMSDTGFYVVTALQNAPGADDTQFWELVGKDVGASNKMLILDAAGRFARLNPAQWSEYKGLWLSNEMSCPEYQFSDWRKYYYSGYSGGTKIYDRSDETPPLKGGDVKEYEGMVLIDTGEQDKPARLTRRERKALNAALRQGNWGPIRRLGTK